MGTYQHGMFVWRELMTTDDAAALRFYSELFGWKAKAMSTKGGTYHLLHVGEKQVGGIMKMPADAAGAPPYWASYLSVPDVDAVCANAKACGGKVMWGPMEMPDVGKMAAIIDPQGACFDVMKATKSDPPYTTPRPGEFCWEQLNTTDVAAAKRFYHETCGWNTKPFGGGIDVLGVRELGSGEQAATLMQAPAGAPAHWLTFVVVEKLAASRERAMRLGGRIMTEKVDVPTIGSFAVVKDPQGATICLFEGA